MSQQLPHNEELERQILASILHGSETHLIIARGCIGGEDFFSPLRTMIYDELGHMWDERKPLDLVLMLERFRTAHLGPTYEALEDEALASARRGSVQPNVFEAYCKQVQALATCRDVQRTCLEIASRFQGGLANVHQSLEQASVQLTTALSKRDQGMRTISSSQAVDAALIEIGDCHPTQQLLGVSWGLTGLDKITKGARPGKMYVIAGRPGMGKSALAQCATRATSGGGNGVLFFSFEMDVAEIKGRFLAAEADLPHDLLYEQYGLSTNNGARIEAAANRLRPLPIRYADCRAATIDELRRAAHVAHAIDPVSMIVVDYMQLMKVRGGDHRSRNDEVAEISRGLKLLAMETQSAVLALSQLNRAQKDRTDKRPQLTDLRDSGAIEQDADCVIFVHRELNQPEKAELIVGKQRGGSTGTVTVSFDRERTKFSDLAQASLWR